MASSRLPGGVGTTALITAYARAQETRLSDALFTDRLAEHLVREAVGADGENGALPRLGPARDDGPSELWDGLYASFAGRTPYFDSYLLNRVRAGCRQIVLLAAGLDARAFRLGLAPGTTVYELDVPAMLEFKASALAGLGATPQVERVPVGVDLRDRWAPALLAAGFDPSVPTAWLAEGLLMYLTATEAGTLLSTITGISAPGSGIAGDYLCRRTRIKDAPLCDEDERRIAELFVGSDRGGPATDPDNWLTPYGWHGGHRDLAAELTALGRSVPTLWDPGRPDPLRLWLFSATAGGRQAS